MTAPLILASASETRRDLLDSLGVKIETLFTPNIDETPLKNERPKQTAIRLAREKAKFTRAHFDSQGQYQQAYILAADTILSIGRRILDKTNNLDEAHRHLNLLSGRAHRVYSAICLSTPDGKFITRISETRTHLKQLTQKEIDNYLSKNLWQGRAGACHYETLEAFVKNIHGSPSGAKGLPLFETRQILIGVGLLK